MMPTNLTLKGLPDDVYERLKQAAAGNFRSLNSEIIATLQAQVLPKKASLEHHLQAASALRQRLGDRRFDHRELDRLKREGRS